MKMLVCGSYSTVNFSLENLAKPLSKVITCAWLWIARAARYASVQTSCEGKEDFVKLRYAVSNPNGSSRKATRGSFASISHFFHASGWLWTNAPMILGFVRCRSNAIWVILQKAHAASDCGSKHTFALSWCTWSE